MFFIAPEPVMKAVPPAARPGVAQQHGGGVEQFVQRINGHHGLALQERRGRGMVARQGARMRLRGLPRAGTSARHQQHQGLAASRACAASFRKVRGRRICSA